MRTLERARAGLCRLCRLCQAGVAAQGVVEVLVDALYPRAGPRIDRNKQVTKLGRRVAAEIVRRAGDEVAALLPGALPARARSRVERVEAGALRRIDAA